MKKVTLLMALLIVATGLAGAQNLPAKKEIRNKMVLANAYFMKKWPDTGKTIITNKERPSNIWTRAVYYEGLMALYSVNPDKAYYDYAMSWGEAHKWGLNGGVKTRNADNHCCGQTYLDLYEKEQKPEMIKDLKESIDAMIASDKIDDWTWIDALQMAMPVYAKLGVITGDKKYSERNVPDVHGLEGSPGILQSGRWFVVARQGFPSSLQRAEWRRLLLVARETAGWWQPWCA